MSFLPFYMVKPPYRVISFDGGGIYGYFTTLMLRQLCERNPSFLNGKDDTIFAGISAGALIALALAKEQCPRDAIMSGEIEAMFHDYRLYSNLDPVTAIGSIVGLSSWCSGPLMKDFCQEKWGVLSLGELPQRVLISTFDFIGPDDEMSKRKWGPRNFRNFGEDDQSGVSAAFIAYGATAPATYRPVDGGISDAGYFAINPAMGATTLICAMGPEEREFWRSGAVSHLAIAELLAQIKVLHELVITGGDSSGYGRIREIMRATQSVVRGELTHMKNLFKEMITVGYSLETTEMLMDLIARIDTMIASGLFECSYPEHFDPNAILTCTQCNIRGCLQLWNLTVKSPIFPAEEPWHRVWDQTWVQVHDDFFGSEERHTTGLFQMLASPRGDDNQTRLLVIASENLLQSVLGLFVAAMAQTPDRSKHTQAFSMGTGTFIPGYFLRNFDLGWLNINLMPTNIQEQTYGQPPWYLMIDPSIESTNTQAHELLGDNFLRFSPNVVKWPVPNMVISLYLSRFELFRKPILDGIKTKANDVTESEYGRASLWLERRGWTVERPQRPAGARD